jgi:hypothetical protein
MRKRVFGGEHDQLSLFPSFSFFEAGEPTKGQPLIHDQVVGWREF